MANNYVAQKRKKANETSNKNHKKLFRYSQKITTGKRNEEAKINFAGPHFIEALDKIKKCKCRNIAEP